MSTEIRVMSRNLALSEALAAEANRRRALGEAADGVAKEMKKKAAMNILSAMSLLSMGDLISGVNSIPRMHGRGFTGTGTCKCGRRISANKEMCLECATESVENAKTELRKVVFGE